MTTELREVVHIETGQVESMYCKPPDKWGECAISRKITKAGAIPRGTYPTGTIRASGTGSYAYHDPEREPQAQRIRDDIAAAKATLAMLRRTLAAVYTTQEATS